MHALSQGASLILDTFLLFSSVLDGFGVVLCRLWFDKHSLLGATKTFARHSVALPLWHQATATVAHLLNCGAKRKLRCWVRPWQCDTQHALNMRKGRKAKGAAQWPRYVKQIKQWENIAAMIAAWFNWFQFQLIPSLALSWGICSKYAIFCNHHICYYLLLGTWLL